MSERICPHCGKPIKNPERAQKYHKKCYEVVSAHRRPHYKSQTEWRKDKTPVYLDLPLHKALVDEQTKHQDENLSKTIERIKAERDELKNLSL